MKLTCLDEILWKNLSKKTVFNYLDVLFLNGEHFQCNAEDGSAIMGVSIQAIMRGAALFLQWVTLFVELTMAICWTVKGH